MMALSWRGVLARGSMAGILTNFTYLINRAALRSRLLQVEPFASLRQRASLTRKKNFARGLETHAGTGAICEEVRANGITMLAHPAALLGPSADVIALSVARAGSTWDWGPTDLLETEDILTQNPDVYRIGLETGLLELAERYLGEPCFYLGCSLKHERVGAAQAGARQWHFDNEDDRMLRLIFYLNDVDEAGGPFQYIDAANSGRASARLEYRVGYLNDALVRSVVADEHWTSVPGPAGLMIAFDGTRVFHRAAAPTRADRLSLSITYTSRFPLQIKRQVRLRRASRRGLLASLSKRQRACVPAARWF